jgi:hypothetical protein
MERTLRERNRLRKLEDARKEKRWLNPTEAQLMQSREYLDWFQMQPEQYGDEPPNNTFDLFLTERRRVKEKERLRLFEDAECAGGGGLGRLHHDAHGPPLGPQNERH